MRFGTTRKQASSSGIIRERKPEMTRYNFFIKLFAVALIVTMFAAVAPAGHASADNSAPTGPASGVPTAPVLVTGEQYLLTNINAVRQAAGLGTLTIDATLEKLSRYRSTDMATRGYFSHYTPEGTTFIDMINNLNLYYSNIGEIINRNNYDNADSPQIAFTSFMNSPLHKSYIMTAEFSEAGVGMATDANGVKYYTVIFLAQ